MTHILRIGGIWKVGLAELVDPGFWSVDLWILLQIFLPALGRSFEALTNCQWREGSMLTFGSTGILDVHFFGALSDPMVL